MKIFLLLALGCSALSCAAYTYVQAGVESNFLIDRERVIFAQSDGSLTALSLESGNVLFRNKTRDFSGSFQRTPQGVLLFSSQSIGLMNPTNFTTTWETTSRFEPNVADDALVTHDGNGHVQCRRLKDGSLRWSYELSEVSTLVAESGKVLVHRNATYDEEKFPVVVLLELESGKLLFRRTATNGVHWAKSFFNGTNVFIVTGPYKTNRSDYKAERLAVWNTRGEETGSIPIPPPLRQAVRAGELFELDHKTFWQGRVYAGRQSIPGERLGKPVTIIAQTNSPSRTIQTVHELGLGDVLIERATYVTGKKTNEISAFAMQIELRAPTNRWTGVLSYLLDRGRITAVAQAGGRILMGTDMGHVECLDADTGESLWLYVFPTLHRTVSSSPHDPAPTFSEAAAAFQRDNSHRPSWGFQVVGGKASKPRIVFDPNPIDPYRKLNSYLAIAWCGGGIPLAVLILLHVLPGPRKWEPGSVGSMAAWLSFIVFCCYVYFGQVSAASSLTLKIALGAGFAAGIWNAVKSYRRGQWLEGTILFVVFGAVALFIAQALF